MIRIRPAVTAAALALIGLWVAWWGLSLDRDSLVCGGHTWVPVLPFLAADFTVHIDHVARVWASGVNPYERPCDWVCALFPYPPMIPRLFAWVALVSTPTAVRVWLAVVAACLAIGAIAVWRTRRALGLCVVPPLAVVVAVLYSTPAVVAMERGQCDPLIVPALVAAAGLLGRRTSGREFAAGGLLGLTAWLKYYPAMTLVGLVALGRWRAAAAFVAVAGLIGVVDRADVLRSVENGATLARIRTSAEAFFCHPTTHSLVEDWRAIRVVRRVRWLRTVPPPLASALLLVPAAVLVSVRVGRVRERDRGPLALPYLLWLSAAATFAMPYSVDYNLVPLPLAALAVWDRRDPWPVHAALGLSLATWWQPFALPLAGDTLLLVKLAALHAVGMCLCNRAREAVEVKEGDGSASFSEGMAPIPDSDSTATIQGRRHDDASDDSGIGPGPRRIEADGTRRALDVDRRIDAASAGLGHEPRGGLR